MRITALLPLLALLVSATARAPSPARVKRTYVTRQVRQVRRVCKPNHQVHLQPPHVPVLLAPAQTLVALPSDAYAQTFSSSSASSTSAASTTSTTSSATSTSSSSTSTAEPIATADSVLPLPAAKVRVKVPIPGPEQPQPQPAAPVNAAPLPDKHVFAHFMVGIVSNYTASNWEYDITLAQAAHISGFALNIGKDPYNQDQLDLAYTAADNLGFQMFISFDFNWFNAGDTGKIVELLKRYAGRSSQLLVENKVFVSTFIGDGFDWKQVADQVGRPLYTMPFYQPNADYIGRADIDGLFSWAAWPGQLHNQPIKQEMSLDRDNAYLQPLKQHGKKYMAPVSPWFYTHFGKEVPYSKNWLFYSELLWKTRWDQILKMGDDLNFVEIITWNDYGESHHVGPYKHGHTDDGSSKWNDGLDHTAMLDMAVPYIKAFRAGLKTPVIEQDMLVYWYRPHLKSAQCNGSDNCGYPPKGAEMVEDSVFVTVLSKNGGTVTVTSGNKPPSEHTVQPGSQAFAVPMGVGKQHFKFTPTGGATKEDTGTVEITDQCRNGVYNFNFHAGSIKI